MRKFSENKRKLNLLKVKSCYFVSYTAYDNEGAFRTSGYRSFESDKKFLTPNAIKNISGNIKNSNEKLKDFVIIIDNIQKIK